MVLKLTGTNVFTPTSEVWDNEVIGGNVKPRTVAYYVGGDYTEGTISNSDVETTLLDYTIPANTVVNGIKISARGWIRGDVTGMGNTGILRIKIVGAEMITNGTFDTDTSWVYNAADWTYSVANKNIAHDAAGTSTLNQPIANMVDYDVDSNPNPLVIGQTYQVTFILSAFSAGTVTPSCGGWTGTMISYSGGDRNGTYSESFICTDDTLPLTFTPSSAARFTIDNISLGIGCDAKITQSAGSNGEHYNVDFFRIVNTSNWTVDNIVTVTGKNEDIDSSNTSAGSMLCIEGY